MEDLEFFGTSLLFIGACLWFTWHHAKKLGMERGYRHARLVTARAIRTIRKDFDQTLAEMSDLERADWYNSHEASAYREAILDTEVVVRNVPSNLIPS